MLQELHVGIFLHWTEKIFVEHGDLWLKFSNRGPDTLAQKSKEIEALGRIFSEAGVNAGSRVLDLCCGSGGHALNLAKKGFNVTGVDFSAIAIKCAEELAEKIEVKNRVDFLVGDAREISKLLERKNFDAIISMGTSIGYYDDDTDKSIVKQLNKLASSNCVLIMDVGNRDYIMKHFQPLNIVSFDDCEFHDYRSLNFQESRCHNNWEFYKKDGVDLKHIVTVSLYSRLYSLHELISLFENTGWKYSRSYGNFDLEPVTTDTPRIIIVGKKG